MNTATDDEYHSYKLPPVFDPLASELSTAMTLERTMDPNAHAFDHPIESARRLRVFSKAVEDGDLSQVRRILANQMVMLERLFQHFVYHMPQYRTSKQDFERFAKLALRAQNQMARTAAVLNTLTNSAAKKPKPEMPKAGLMETKPAARKMPKMPDELSHLRGGGGFRG